MVWPFIPLPGLVFIWSLGQTIFLYITPFSVWWQTNTQPTVWSKRKTALNGWKGSLLQKLRRQNGKQRKHTSLYCHIKIWRKWCHGKHYKASTRPGKSPSCASGDKREHLPGIADRQLSLKISDEWKSQHPFLSPHQGDVAVCVHWGG